MIGPLGKQGPAATLRQHCSQITQRRGKYCPPIQVLEPNWESMVAKIRSGRVTNVDHVLEIHSDFLSTCLNDCMLSSPQLLTTVKKLLRSVQSYIMTIAHKKSHRTNVVVVNNQSVNSKTAANLFYCYVIGCSQQQHSFRGISCGLWR